MRTRPVVGVAAVAAVAAGFVSVVALQGQLSARSGAAVPAAQNRPPPLRVAFHEYERAVGATVACLRQHGVDVSEPRLDRWGAFFEYDYSLDDPNAHAIYEDCYEEHLRNVEVAWTAQAGLSPAEQSVAVDRVVACLRLRGIDLPPQAAFGDLVAALGSPSPLSPQEGRCIASVRWMR